MANPKKSQKPTKSFGTNIKNFFQKNYKNILFILSFFIINCALLAITCVGKDVNISSKRFIIAIIAMIIINIALCIFTLYAKKRNLPIEKVFLIIGTVLGLMYTFIIPIGRAPDEPAHIWRAYAVSQGNILADTDGEVNGNYLPENIANLGATYTEDAYSQLTNRITEPISDNQVFHKTITSNPIDYFPQIIGILIGRLLHLPMVLTLYLARLCGLAICIIVIYYCIKYIPILKKPLLFISCLPLSMQMFVSISYDGMIYCSAIAIISFLLFTMFQAKYIFKPLHGLMLSLLCFILIAVKPVYFPICFLLSFIPNRCFKTKKHKILSIIIILLCTVGLFLLWSSLSIITEPGNGADTNGQIAFIMSNPFRYLVILIHNIFNMPFIYLQRLGALEWLDVHTSDFYIISSLIVFAIICTEEYYTSKIKTFPRSFGLAVIAMTAFATVLVFSALYIQWTQVGAYIIEGVQTRYFLPMLINVPLIVAIYKSNRHRSNTPIENIYLNNYIIFINLNAITILLCAHI